MQSDPKIPSQLKPLRKPGHVVRADGTEDAGDSVERKKYKAAASQLDPNESESGRRPTRSEENTPRYRR